MKLPVLTYDDMLIDPTRRQEAFIPNAMGCGACKNMLDWNDKKRRCRAFPDGVPDAITKPPYFKHTEPYPGDNGIMFEPCLIKLESNRVGVYKSWEGLYFDAETLKHIKYESEVR